MRLAWRRELAEYSLDVGPEPDVEHAVGLVEHDMNDVAQIERSPLHVVEDAAGGADDQVDARVPGARICRSIGSPPKMPLTATVDPTASFWSSATICCVSSRVGARTIACGPRVRGSSISISGIPKAAVFPVPVLAWPMTSRPSSASGMKAA